MINRLRGFTLIELLVVIAIIALLVSILLPSLNKARDVAKEVLCSTRARQIGVANQMYAIDNKDLIVPGFYSDANGTGHWWVVELRPYIGEELATGKTAETFICPSDTTRGGVKAFGGFSSYCSGLSENSLYCRSFCINGMLMGGRMTQANNASSVLLAGGMQWWLLNTNFIWPIERMGSDWIDNMPRNWHENGVSMVLLDGHVTTEQPDTLYPGGENENYWYIN